MTVPLATRLHSLVAILAFAICDKQSFRDITAPDCCHISDMIIDNDDRVNR